MEFKLMEGLVIHIDNDKVVCWDKYDGGYYVIVNDNGFEREFRYNSADCSFYEVK